MFYIQVVKSINKVVLLRPIRAFISTVTSVYFDRSKTTLLRYFQDSLPFCRFSVHIACKNYNLKNKKKAIPLIAKD